jgi:hypothetical protein
VDRCDHVTRIRIQRVTIGREDRGQR